ncbi:Rv3235 family protein [Streptomyces roseochromogenus]|uniref:Rv3235 family protein n=1 Tax=Streptomyces roseochromogenus TaxID=285450 RepID=UPI0004CDF897|nr:Rv3235 family protein [Streptomyces roseochromogenus]
MNKVMSRTAQPRPRHRPPTRHDTRRPGGAPPRKPSVRSKREMPPATPRNASTARTAPGTALPPVRPTDVFAERLLAVLSGQRPVHWMLRHTMGRAYDDLARLAERSPLRARGSRPVVHDIGYYVPSEGALEVFARISAGDQLRALAFRLELGQDLRWRCTAVETGPRPAPAQGD